MSHIDEQIIARCHIFQSFFSAHRHAEGECFDNRDIFFYDQMMDMKTLDLLLPALEDCLPGSFIRKVHQMTAYHLLFKLGGSHGSHNLLCSLAPEDSGLHLTQGRFANPPRPLRFCAYLRHHLQGARIVSIEQLPGDRIMVIRATRADSPVLSLIIELTGKQGNLIIARGESQVIEELLFPRHPAANDRLRQQMPYQPPERPPTASGNRSAAIPVFLQALEAPDGLDSFALHEAYDHWFLPRYQERYGVVNRRQILSRLRKVIKREKRKIDNITREQQEKQLHLQQEPWGELLKSSLAKIKRGDTNISVVNYWSPTMEEVAIPLNPALSPQENLEHHFRKVKKAKRGLKMIADRLANAHLELAYYQDLLFQAEENDRMEELAGYAELLGQSSPTGGKQCKAADKPKKTVAGAVETHPLPDGAMILVGRSAAGNENIYRHLGSDSDLWFHAHSIPGAHVLLKPAPGQRATAEQISLAAGLAAVHSRGKNDTRVTVDYLPLKYLKKPKGGKPGQVLIAGSRQTITITPATVRDNLP
ncbi:MAG: NFACT family protein [Deltaproteobacteria bacterium]|nr:NFACT family protein [Candidatus Anaeroferrophillus wilburensis]MBN2889799.1 NFACT family protein [Deltaproteobacteria bacterium]